MGKNYVCGIILVLLSTLAVVLNLFDAATPSRITHATANTHFCAKCTEAICALTVAFRWSLATPGKVETDLGAAPLHNGSLREPAENILPEHGEYNQTGHADEEVKSSQAPSDSESEVFCDSLEHVEPDQVKRLSATQNLSPNNIQSVKSGEKTGCKPPTSSTREGNPNKVLQTIPTGRGLGSGAVIQQEVDLRVISAIQALQEDMKKVMERLDSLESWATLQGHTSMPNPCQPTSLHNGKELPGWPAQLSPRTWFFLLAWPFVIQWLHWYFQRKKR